MVKPYSARKSAVRNVLLPATLPKWHRIVIFGLFCHFSVKQIFTFPTHFEGCSGSFSTSFLALFELIELFAILQCFPHDLFDLIIWVFTGLLVYMQHSSSPMIDTDSGAVFHIRFPRSHFLDFGPFLRPIRKMDKLWMWNTTTNMTFSLWKTSFTKPFEIYIRLYISTRTQSQVLFRTHFAILQVLFSLFQLDVILFLNMGRLPRF